MPIHTANSREHKIYANILSNSCNTLHQSAILPLVLDKIFFKIFLLEDEIV